MAATNPVPMSIDARAQEGTLLQGRWKLFAVAAVSAVFAAKLSESENSLMTLSVSAIVHQYLIVIAVYASAAAAVLLAATVAPLHLPARAVVLGIALVFGIEMGYQLAVGLLQLEGWRSDPLSALTLPSRYFLFGLLGLALFLMEERDRSARRMLHEERLREAEAERAATEAQLSVLQSQVEPHFLFNTLAHLQRLYATDPVAGRAMMQDLLRYLGDAAPALQHASIPLREDAQLAIAYLNLQKVRMRDRLQFSLDLSPETAAARVPPMTLTTLVENSVKHGLAPLTAGGAVRLAAMVCDGSVRIEVTDTGKGLELSLGSGVGLANLRARLELLHGAAARLELRQQASGGVTATVWIPAAGAARPC